MINIGIEISLYIITAIIIGFIFGGLIIKLIYEERYEQELAQVSYEIESKFKNKEALEQELEHYKKVNQKLIEKNTEVSLGYTGQKYVLDEHNDALDEFQKMLRSKDEVIETLTTELSLAEDKQGIMKKKHEEEVDAFLYERIDITEKYKKLLDKQNTTKNYLPRNEENSWFSKLFSVPSKS